MTISGLLIRIVILLCFLQFPLKNVFPFFSYYDEFLAVVMLITLVVRTSKRMRISKPDVLMIACLVLLAFYGGFCNMLSDVERSHMAIAQDMVTVIKPFFCYLGAKYLFELSHDCADLIKFASVVSGCIVVLGLVCIPLAYSGRLDMLGDSVRFGLRGYGFIYGSPGMLSQYCAIFAFVALMSLRVSRGRLLSTLLLIFTCVLWASTLRTRALTMIFIVAFLFIVVFIPRGRNKRDGFVSKLTSPAVIIPAGVGVLAIASDQLSHYFGSQATARSYLLDGGIKIFQDYFPFGSGFATYGTEAARAYYSPLYTQYGLNSFWALQEGGTELTDTFWPSILAQFGFIGLFIYIIPLGIMLYQVIVKCSFDRMLTIAAVFYVSFLLVSSTATGVFFSYTTCSSLFFAGMMLGLATSIKND